MREGEKERRREGEKERRREGEKERRREGETERRREGEKEKRREGADLCDVVAGQRIVAPGDDRKDVDNARPERHGKDGGPLRRLQKTFAGWGDQARG